MIVFDCEADIEGVLQGAGLIEAMHHSSYSSQAPVQSCSMASCLD